MQLLLIREAVRVVLVQARKGIAMPELTDFLLNLYVPGTEHEDT